MDLSKGTRGPELSEYCLNCTTFNKFIFKKIIKLLSSYAILQSYKSSSGDEIPERDVTYLLSV